MNNYKNEVLSLQELEDDFETHSVISVATAISSKGCAAVSGAVSGAVWYSSVSFGCA